MRTALLLATVCALAASVDATCTAASWAISPTPPQVKPGDAAFAAEVSAFSWALADLGRDLDADGRTELLVSDWDTDTKDGSVWVAFPKADGTISSAKKIVTPLPAKGHIGINMAGIGDIRGDGTAAFAAGTELASVFLISLKPAGAKVGELNDYSYIVAGTNLVLAAKSQFGQGSLAILNIGGEGVLLVTEPADGTTWALIEGSCAVNGACTVAQTSNKITSTGDGESAAALGDVNADGVNDAAIGSMTDGVVKVFLFNSDFTTKASPHHHDG
jgi:hypothetical protein